MNAISAATRRKCIISRASRPECYGGLEPKTSKRWSREELGTLVFMREDRGATWREISAAIPGRSPAQCEQRYSYGRHSTSTEARYATSYHKCSETQLAEREARLAGYDARNFSEAWQGDPPRGFSALDRRGQDKPRQPSLPVITATIVRYDGRGGAR